MIWHRRLATGATECTVLSLSESSAVVNEEAVGMLEDYNVVWVSQSNNSGESMPVGREKASGTVFTEMVPDTFSP